MTGPAARDSGEEVLSIRACARVGAVLLLVSGCMSFVDYFVRSPDAAWGKAAVLVISTVSLLLVLPTALLPWQRWRREALLFLVVPVLALIGVGTAVDPSPYASGVYYLVAAMWIGLSQRRGIMLALAPVIGVSYLVPLRLAGVTVPEAYQAMPLIVVASVVVGETLSFVTNRLRRTHAELHAGWHRRLTAMVRESSDVTILVGPTDVIEYVSPSAEDVLGFDIDEMVGTTLTSFVASRLADDDIALALGATSTLAGGFTGTVEARIVDGRGELRHVEATLSNLLEDPDVRAQVVNVRDITERKALEAQLLHQAVHDPLCGLPNRALFEDRLTQAILRLDPSRQVGVLFCDIDGFKTVNDTLGHGEGDRVLVALGTRLLAAVGDRGTLARFGGDEFAVLIDDMRASEEAMALADRVLAAAAEPLHLGGRRFTVGLSIGVACTGSGRPTPADLLGNADAAMYVAKSRGKGCVVEFDPLMRHEAKRRLDLGGDLWRAVDEGGIVLHYQPTIRLRTGEVTGFEALARWNHPEIGMIQPVDFIPVAEENGAIVPIGAWVLHEACRQAAEWRLVDPTLTIAVNVAARQLRDDALIHTVSDALAASGLDARALLLEVTESVLLDDLDTTLSRLQQLKRIGVRLAIDDFGTGYSSLAYLGRYPFDVLKIDRSFVEGAALRPDAAAVVRAIVELGRNLGMETVAEGVETDGQAMLLSAMGCPSAQGFLYGRPMPADEATALVDRGRRAKRRAERVTT